MPLQNDYLLAVLLGIIEGVTEFLPISSTAHLRIAQAWLGLSLDNEYWKMFAVVIQLGAILSVVVYFWRRLREFLDTFPVHPKKMRFALRHPLSLTALAFFVTAIPSFLLSKLIGENLESLKIIGASLLIGGVAMWIIDVRYARGKIKRIEDMNWLHAAWIGAIQILSAVFPGTSRSMSTIAGGQTIGLSRSAALEFSFFVSIPTMFAATGYDLLKTLLKNSASAPAVAMGTHEWLVLALGFATSFLVAWAVIAWFMSWVRARGFVPFAIYRILFGAAVLTWAIQA